MMISQQRRHTVFLITERGHHYHRLCTRSRCYRCMIRSRICRHKGNWPSWYHSTNEGRLQKGQGKKKTASVDSADSQPLAQTQENRNLRHHDNFWVDGVCAHANDGELNLGKNGFSASKSKFPD